METFTQLGISGLTLAILFFVIRYFVAAMVKKDEYIVDITEKFNTTISNHIQHSTEQIKLQIIAFEKLSQAIQELALQIKNNGLKK